VQEQIRRKDELCAQLEAEATAAENLHHEQLTSLCGKINALENDLQIVNEEDCVREWRKLRMSLDRWVKRNFQNTAKLDQLDYTAILRSMGTPAPENIATRNNHQRWAILQAWIMGMLHRHIFLNPCPGLNSNEIELFHELDRLIFEQCVCIFPSRSFTNRYQGGVNTWKHCKSGINTALSTFVKPSRATLIEQLVTDVEKKLGEYTSTVQGNRQQQLYSIFSQCADFKVMCSQQPQIYKFISSPSGCTVERTCMANAAGIIDCSEMTVAFSLWPSLWKGEGLENSYCLEPELIWAFAV
jgi:hypothetical protein